MRIPFALLMACALALGARAVASAQQQEPAEERAASDAQAEGGEQRDEQRPRTPPYADKLQTGIRLAAARDTEAALAALREASELEPSRPQAHYYMGVTKRFDGDLDGALELFRTAAQRASAARDADYRARALVAIAETLERRATHAVRAGDGEGAAEQDTLAVNVEGLSEARDAWGEVQQMAERGHDLLNASYIRARVKAIDKVVEQERAYVDVRKRIAEREAKNREENGKRKGK